MFNHRHITSSGIFVMVMVLVIGTDACGGRSPSPKPKPIPKPSVLPTQTTTEQPSATTETITGRTLSSTSPPTTGTGPVGETFTSCFSTVAQNVTNVTIKERLNNYSRDDILGQLFKVTDTMNVFLQISNQNGTGCSNVQGYMIKISRNDENETSYEYDISKLNDTLAKTKCNQYTNTCVAVPSISPPKVPNAATSQITTTESNENTPTQPEGSRAAKTDDNGMSLLVIVIPVAVVSVLIVIAIIFAIWFKRRSTGKSHGDDKMTDLVDRAAGPVNGDVYTIVNPSSDKNKNGKSDNDLVYTELSHMKSEKASNKHPEQSEPEEYADITHVLKAGETAYENVALKNDEEYTNVAALKT